MKNRVVRFILLALFGAMLGAGIAYFQGAGQVAPEQAATILKQKGMSEAEEMNNASGDKVAKSADDSMQAADTGAVATGVPIGGEFNLTDQDGNPVNEDSWHGAYRLMFFGFTHCPDICPTAMQKIVAVMDGLGQDFVKIQPIFITTDPERDTVEVVNEYVGMFDPRIVGLTGTQEQIDKAISAYKVYATKVNDPNMTEYTMDHSGYMYLMSPEDELLEIFRTSDTADNMVKKIQKHLDADTATDTPAEEPKE